MATSYAQTHPDEVEGLILLGSWIADLGGDGASLLLITLITDIIVTDEDT